MISIKRINENRLELRKHVKLVTALLEAIQEERAKAAKKK